MDEIYFRLTKEGYTMLDGLICYSLSAGTFHEQIVHGNIANSERRFNQSVANSIYDMDDFESSCRSLVNSDFPSHKDWVVEEIAFEDLEEVKEEITYFQNYREENREDED